MLVIGHRGARALEPENTIRGLRRGMKCADYVEVDVRLSGDSVPVIMHDATLDRTTDGTGPVKDRSLAELLKFDAGAGERIPTLEDVCLLVAEECGLVIEIKEPGSEEEIAGIVRLHRSPGLIIVSFHEKSLSAVRELLPSVRTGFIFSRNLENPVAIARALGADVILPKFTLTDGELVEEAHAHGILVFPWTLNTPMEFQMAVDLKVDGFASDNPCAARKYLSGDAHAGLSG